MNIPIRFLTAVLLGLGTSLYAQETGVKETPELNRLSEATEQRAQIANSVTDDTISALKALAKLRKVDNPSGLPVNQHADLGYAAIDIGRRLVAAGKNTAAEAFFRAAEQAMTRAVGRTANDKAREKSQYLANLARIRENYLGKSKEAGIDIQEALALQPDDKHLQRLNRILSAREKSHDRVVGHTTGRKEANQ